MAGLGIANVAGDIIGGGISLYEYLNTKSQLKDLESQPFPEEQVSSELQTSYNQALALSNEGYTPQEKSSFQDQTNRATATQYKRATQASGGQGANEISAALDQNEILSYDKFSAQDAELHRQNIAALSTQADKIQEEKNRIQDERIQHRYSLEQALGQSNKTALEGIMKSFSIGGNLLEGSNPDLNEVGNSGYSSNQFKSAQSGVQQIYPGSILGGDIGNGFGQ